MVGNDNDRAGAGRADSAARGDFIRILTGAWSEQNLEDSLKVIAQGVCEIAGFGVSALSVLRDSGRLEVVAVAGDPAAEQHLLGSLRPLAQLERDIADSQDWGHLRFVPHASVVDRQDDLGWISDVEPRDHPDAWQPLDLLFALLHDEDGRLVGSLSVDLPVDGLRPGPARQGALTRYVAQAARAVVALVDRERAREEVRLAEASRRILRVASGQLSIEQLLEKTQPEIITGFACDGMWLQAFDNFGRGRDAIYSNDDREIVLPPELITIAHASADGAWAEGTVRIVSRARPEKATMNPAWREAASDFLDSINVATALLIPLGAGEETLGLLVLVRNPGSPEWTNAEEEASLSLGRDLGRVLFNARTFDRDQHLLEEMRALNAYKSELIAMVSHEFKNPLTGMLGHLEILEDTEVEPGVRRSLDVIGRAAGKLESLAGELLILARAGDPNRPVVRLPVDVAATAREVVELCALEASRRGLDLTLDVPDHPVLTTGEPSELERVCSNLVSNGIKYSTAGGTVHVRVHELAGQVTLRVSDDGLGISEEDQERLFTEFFRSTNPEALHRPGTGLGLTIVARTVERHGGTIDVRSELGVGTAFTVTLPAAPA